MRNVFTRREFARTGLGFVGLSATAPTFLSKTAWAMFDPQDAPLTRSKPGVPEERILVILQLAGGNDGLNTVVPFRDDDYHRARKTLAVKPRGVLPIHDDLGFHPSAKSLKKLHDEGLLAIVQGVGYPNPNRSHFVGTDIWATADPQRHTFTGWAGRYFDSCCQGADPADPKWGIALTKEAPLAMQGGRFSPISFTSPDQLQWKAHRSNADAKPVFERLNHPPETLDPNRRQITTLDFLRRAAFDAQANLDEIRKAASLEQGGPRSGLESHLMMVAQMIAAGLPTRIYYVSLSGFDTHARQQGRHESLLEELGDALSSFFTILTKRRLADRVLLMTFSEFGRRVAENASGGTDHGAAAPLFLAGTPVRPGLHGRHPSLTDLDEGDLKHAVDFRSVYATVLEHWLKVDSRKILNVQTPTLPLLKTSV